MASTLAVKTNAKLALKGNYIKAIFASCVLVFSQLILWLICSMISVIGNVAAVITVSVLVNVFLISPLFLGLLRFFKRLAFGCNDEVVSVFYYFSDFRAYKRAMEFVLKLFVRVLQNAVVSFLPAIIVRIATMPFIYDLFDIKVPQFAANLWAAKNIFIFLGGVCFVLITLKLYLAPFLFVAQENKCAAEAILMSGIIARRSLTSFVFLCFCMSFYIIISLFALPLVFTAPYFFAAYIVHSRYSVAQYNNHIEENDMKDPHYAADI